MIDDLRIPAILSMACLYVLAALGFLGLIYRGYKDNWLQTIGLVGIVIGALGRADTIGDREHITWERLMSVSTWITLPRSDTTSFEQFLSVFSLALFGIGTAWKVWQHNRGKNG